MKYRVKKAENTTLIETISNLKKEIAKLGKNAIQKKPQKNNGLITKKLRDLILKVSKINNNIPVLIKEITSSNSIIKGNLYICYRYNDKKIEEMHREIENSKENCIGTKK